jgi:hypothetical protein
MAVLLPIMIGCGPPPGEVQTSLTEIHVLHVRATADTFSVELGDDNPDQWEPCATAFPELSAQLDDLPLPVATLGGKIGDEPGDDVSDNVCEAPKLSVAMPPPDHASHLQIKDHLGAIDCDLPDLKSVRSATLVPAGPWTLKAGQSVTVQWSPGGDAKPGAISVELLTFDAAGALDGLITINGIAVAGDLVTFTLPSIAPGSYELQFARFTSLACGPGAANADLMSNATTFGFAQPIMIAP